jgi:hypothetical protein
MATPENCYYIKNVCEGTAETLSIQYCGPSESGGRQGGVRTADLIFPASLGFSCARLEYLRDPASVLVVRIVCTPRWMIVILSFFRIGRGERADWWKNISGFIRARGANRAKKLTKKGDEWRNKVRPNKV